MEIQTTEASENPTDTTEALDQSKQLPVADPQTTDALEPSPVTNTQTAETLAQSTLSQVTNTESAETLNQSTPTQVKNTQTAENLEQSTPPEATYTQKTEPSDQPTQPPAMTTQATETLEQSTMPPLTNTKAAETLEHTILPSAVADNSHENLVSSPKNHQGMEMRQETAEEEKAKSVIKAIAATGKFWHDWEKLRSMLSLHLKQVISEYPQAKMTTEEQKMLLGETHAELVKRLDDALHSFVDGPPFTLQRLCEIILEARSLYPNLSKLALALEKNLSVTSTLSISTDPYPPITITPPNGLDKITKDPTPNLDPNPQPDTIMENGAQPVAADRDEIMTEVEADVSDITTMDMETYEKSSESVPETTGTKVQHLRSYI